MTQARRTKAAAKTAETPPAAEAAAQASEAASTAVAETVRVKKKKKKRRYSRGTRDFQELERGLTRSTARLADAVASGLDSYRSRSDRSARRRRDGAMRDLPDNLTRAVGVAVRRASRAPNDFVRRVNTRRLWRNTRDLISPFGWFR